MRFYPKTAEKGLLGGRVAGLFLLETLFLPGSKIACYKL
jgi:hypothetical protein